MTSPPSQRPTHSFPPGQVDISSLSTPELTAFFINLYNALIVHALVVLGTEMNTVQRVRFFASAKYCIGGLQYSGGWVGGWVGWVRGCSPLWAKAGWDKCLPASSVQRGFSLGALLYLLLQRPLLGSLLNFEFCCVCYTYPPLICTSYLQPMTWRTAC